MEAGVGMRVQAGGKVEAGAGVEVGERVESRGWGGGRGGRPG